VGKTNRGICRANRGGGGGEVSEVTGHAVDAPSPSILLPNSGRPVLLVSEISGR
jgi:hypothetical protein